AGVVVNREQRIAPGACRLLVALSRPDEDELPCLVDGRRGPYRHTRTRGRIVLRRVDAPSHLARVGIETHDVAAERVIGLLDPLLERGDADDDGVAGEDR